MLITAVALIGITATAQVKVGANVLTLATNAAGTTDDAVFQVEGNAITNQFVVLQNGNVAIGSTLPVANFDVSNGLGSTFSGNRYVKTSQVLASNTVTGTIQLTDASTALEAGNTYRIEVNTQGTGVSTGCVYIAYQTSAAVWVLKRVSSTAYGSNQPKLALSGTSVVVTSDHPASYNYRTTVTRYGTLNNTLINPTIFGLEGAMTNLSGNIGIGNEDPTAKLEVNGNVKIVTTPTITGATKVLVKNSTNNEVSEQAVALANVPQSNATVAARTQFQVVTGNTFHSTASTGVILVAPDNTTWLITVENGGVLKTQAVTP